MSIPNNTGYDPGLSIQSALKLPRSLELADSITGKTIIQIFVIRMPFISTRGFVSHNSCCSFFPVFLNKMTTSTTSSLAAVSNADFISLNIPYIKGENGTHGIIGREVIQHFKPTAVLLNFARGELVDSEAMKEFLDNNDGRYVSDFPDDLLWDHKDSIILPHLGASTAEAEDAAVS